MNYILDMSVLRIHSKQSCLTMNEMSRLLGMSSNTLSRYVTGVRNPDLPTLLHLCNTLRMSVGSFIRHSDVPLRLPVVYSEDTFRPVSFRYEAIDHYRKEHNLTRVSLLQHIRKHSHYHIDSSTYVRLLSGGRISMDLPIGFLNACDQSLHYLFDDPQLSASLSSEPLPAGSPTQDYLDKLTADLRKLEEENRLLLAENRRLKKRLRRASPDLPTHAPDLTMRRLLNKLHQSLSELEGWCDPSYEPPSGQ